MIILVYIWNIVKQNLEKEKGSSSEFIINGKQISLVENERLVSDSFDEFFESRS